MKFKTPMQFGVFSTLEDADGQVVLNVSSHVFPETQQAIIDTFEDAARWQFMTRVADNPGGAEDLAMRHFGSLLRDDAPQTSATFNEIVDEARASLAAP